MKRKKIAISLLFGLMLLVFSSFMAPAETKALTQVSSFSALKSAIESGETEIELSASFDFNGLISVPENKTITIDGKDKTLTRSNSYAGSFLSIPSSSNLTIKNLTEDGLASHWTLNVDGRYAVGNNYMYMPMDLNGDALATNQLIINNGGLIIQNSKFKNNASSVSGSVIYNYGTLNILSSHFEKNYSSFYGGVSYSLSGSTVKVSDSYFAKNLVGTDGSIGSGGVFFIEQDSYFETKGSTIEENYAQMNGAYANVVATNTIVEKNLFNNNQIGNDGGVMQLNGLEGHPNKTFLSRNNIYSNNVAYAPTQSLGGVYCFARVMAAYTDITFDSDTFSNNRAIMGGALSTYNGTNDTEIDSYPITIKNSTFENNKANLGGAIAFSYDSNITIDNTNFSKNNGTKGGAAYLLHAKYLRITNSTFEENNSTNTGGAIYTDYNEKTEIKNTSIINNTASNTGGMLYKDSEASYYTGKLSLDNVTIKGNHSETGGGGLTIDAIKDSEDIDISNSTIAENSTDEYGGGIAIQNLVGISMNIANNIKIYNNTAKLGGDDIYINETPEEYVDRLGTINLISAPFMGIDSVNIWAIDEPDNRYSDNNRNAIESLKITNEKTSYIKAASDGSLPINPQTADWLPICALFLMVAIAGSLSLFGNYAKRR